MDDSSRWGKLRHHACQRSAMRRIRDVANTNRDSFRQLCNCFKGRLSTSRYDDSATRDANAAAIAAPMPDPPPVINATSWSPFTDALLIGNDARQRQYHPPSRRSCPRDVPPSTRPVRRSRHPIGTSTGQRLRGRPPSALPSDGRCAISTGGLGRGARWLAVSSGHARAG